MNVGGSSIVPMYVVVQSTVFLVRVSDKANMFTSGKICGWNQNGIKHSTYSIQFMVPFTLNLTLVTVKSHDFMNMTNIGYCSYCEILLQWHTVTCDRVSCAP